eukprot:scaffold847_cov385-Prasinococcus_capsulatus_cf.AAC.6
MLAPIELSNMSAYLPILLPGLRHLEVLRECLQKKAHHKVKKDYRANEYKACEHNSYTDVCRGPPTIIPRMLLRYVPAAYFASNLLHHQIPVVGDE